MNQAVNVSKKQLIDLRGVGESLALSNTRIRARQAGTYLSRYKGRGIDFEEARLYQPGDDIRSIDWRVTARTGKPHTKVYREERERPVLFCVDFRRPMFFATRGMFKSVVAARTAALLAWSSNHRGDRVGGLVFSEQEHHELRPQRGNSAVLGLINVLVRAAEFDAEVKPLPALVLDKPFARLRRVVRPGSLVFVTSDFRGMSAPAEAHLRQIARHNSVVLVFVYDTLERSLPPAGLYKLTDGVNETVINTKRENTQQRYAQRFQAHHEYLENLSRSSGMSLIPCTTQDDIPSVLRNELILRTAA